MDHKVVDKLEREIKKAIMDVVAHLGLRKLPLLPSDRTMQLMAKAAVAVYMAAVENESSTDTER